MKVWSIALFLFTTTSKKVYRWSHVFTPLTGCSMSDVWSRHLGDLAFFMHCDLVMMGPNWVKCRAFERYTLISRETFIGPKQWEICIHASVVRDVSGTDMLDGRGQRKSLWPHVDNTLSSSKIVCIFEIRDSHSGSALQALPTHTNIACLHINRENVDLTREQGSALQSQSGSRARRHSHAAGELDRFAYLLYLNEDPQITYGMVTLGCVWHDVRCFDRMAV